MVMGERKMMRAKKRVIGDDGNGNEDDGGEDEG